MYIFLNMLQEVCIEGGSAALILVPLLLVCHKLRFHDWKKTGLYLLFSLYLSVVCSLVGLPSIQYIRFQPNVNLIPFVGMVTALRDTLLNILLFLPLGFFLPLLWEDRRQFHRVVLEGFLISLTIELLQILTFRATDVNDLITNTLGTILGYLLGSLLMEKFPRLACPGWDSRDRYLLYAVVLTTKFLIQPTLAGLIWELML